MERRQLSKTLFGNGDLLRIATDIRTSGGEEFTHRALVEAGLGSRNACQRAIKRMKDLGMIAEAPRSKESWREQPYVAVDTPLWACFAAADEVAEN